MAEGEKSIIQEFMEFLNKYSLIGLVVAFVIGLQIQSLSQTIGLT